MTPSRLHDDLAGILDHIVDAAGSAITGAARGLRTTRLRGRNDPPGTGMEPDCAFYLGERARGYRAALAEGEEAAETFFERTPPDLVVEAEITSADEGKIARYGDLGVRELWRLHGRKGSRDLRVEFLVLRSGTEPRSLAASEVLAGLTPEDVCEAADSVRLSLTPDERTTAVARIVRRRQRGSVRGARRGRALRRTLRLTSARGRLGSRARREGVSVSEYLRRRARISMPGSRKQHLVA